MSVSRGDRVVYLGEPLWLGPDEDDYIRRGDTGIVVDLEPPDDAPIVSLDGGGALVLQQSDVRAMRSEDDT